MKVSLRRIICIVALIVVSGLLSTVMAVGETREIARWTNLYNSPDGAPLAGIVLEPSIQVTELNQTRDGHWVLIQTKVGNGWVPATSLARVNNPPANAPPAQGIQGDALITRWTNIYDSPGGSPLPHTVLAPTTPVTVERLSGDGYWALVRAATGRGWIPATAVNARSANNNVPAAPEPAPAQPNPAQPNPEQSEPGQPAPTQPQPEPAQTTSSPQITGVVIDSIDTHKALITLAYTGVAIDGYQPFFFIFDPDNCIVDCEDPDNALDYPIQGLKTVTEGILPSGTIQIEVSLDNLYCTAEPFTSRFVAVIADARPLNSGQTTKADDLAEFPFEHLWCK